MNQENRTPEAALATGSAEHPPDWTLAGSMEEGDAGKEVRAVVRRILEEAGGDATTWDDDLGKMYMPPGLRRDILALGQAAVPFLVEIVANERLDFMEAPGDGYGPAHAVNLLGDLDAAQAIEPMLQALARDELSDPLYERLCAVLSSFGNAVIEPALGAYAACSEPWAMLSIGAVLVNTGVRDDRILEALVKNLGAARKSSDTNFQSAIRMLEAYGDPRAVGPLSDMLDRGCRPGPGSLPLGYREVLMLGDAIEEMGGRLTPRQQVWYADALDTKLAFIRAAEQRSPTHTPARAKARPGRNEPCWCGSGKKYKKCHYDADRTGPATYLVSIPFGQG